MVRGALGMLLLTLAGGAHAAEPSGQQNAGFPWRKASSVVVVGALYGANWAWVSAAWWQSKNENKVLAFRDEGAFGLDTYAGGADKLGHFYSNYLMNRGFATSLSWGGFSRGAAIGSSTLLTTLFFTAIEVKDGYQRNYGFSMGDILANLSGQGTALCLLLAPSIDEAISVKVMYFPSRDFVRALGSDGPLNVLEDYSGQTYLLAWHPASLAVVKRSEELHFLRYFELSFGYATRGYRPVPRAPEPVRQLFSIGLSLDLQTAFDELLTEPGAPRGSAAGAVHFANEVFQLPYTRLPAFTFERWGPAVTQPE